MPQHASDLQPGRCGRGLSGSMLQCCWRRLANVENRQQRLTGGSDMRVNRQQRCDSAHYTGCQRSTARISHTFQHAKIRRYDFSHANHTAQAGRTGPIGESWLARTKPSLSCLSDSSKTAGKLPRALPEQLTAQSLALMPRLASSPSRPAFVSAELAPVSI